MHSCKHTKTQICMDTHRLQTQKQMSADIYAYMLHTHTHEHTDLAHKHRCEQTNVNVLLHLEEYICNKICSAAFDSWRHLSKIEKHTDLFYKYALLHMYK